MSTPRSSVRLLVEEYQTLMDEVNPDRQVGHEIDWSAVAHKLEQDAEWTRRGVDHLTALARDYGSFVLRNALALALALHVEDGDLGL